MHFVAHPYTVTDDGMGVTLSSLEAWEGSRAQFDRFVEVQLVQPQDASGPAYGQGDGGTRVVPTMTLTDAQGRTLALCGVTCGYDGTGPRGAAQILAAEGFLRGEEAVRVATTAKALHMRV